MPTCKWFLWFGTSLITTSLFYGATSNSAKAFTIINPYPNISNATQIKQCELLNAFHCYELELPDHRSELIFQDITNQLGQPPTDFQIIRSQYVIWPNGCRGNYYSGRVCTMALVPEWRVTAEDSMFRWNYEIIWGDSIALISQEKLNPATIIEPRPTSSQAVPEPSAGLFSLGVLALCGRVQWFSRRKNYEV